jgi:hypothetical protein
VVLDAAILLGEIASRRMRHTDLGSDGPDAAIKIIQDRRSNDAEDEKMKSSRDGPPPASAEEQWC